MHIVVSVRPTTKVFLLLHSTKLFISSLWGKVLLQYIFETRSKSQFYKSIAILYHVSTKRYNILLDTLDNNH